MLDYAEPVTKLIDEFKRLPSIGQKSAQRLAFYILRAPEADVARLIGDANCHIYVCGLKDMEDGVDRAFRDACRAHGSDWDQRLPELRAQGRYHVETY